MARARTGEAGGFTLEVPLDASGIEDFEAGREVKVVAQDRKGALSAETVKLGADGKAVAAFAFREHPGSLSVIVGPADASDEELTGLQTIRLDVPPRRWVENRTLRLAPITIAPYYWHWWFRWCRNFTIHGVLLCPDGHPVPGAQVCAYDVDWWWKWSSKQLVGCDVTDGSGAFEIKFKWCCGWWPWWWWKYRFWQLEPALIERIEPVLRRDPVLKSLLETTPQPSLSVFESLLAEDAGLARPVGGAVDPAALSELRGRLLRQLPHAPELERLHIWPWWPWNPWWDCTPDIIFKATQDCREAGTVVLDEGLWDARWNIPTTLNVTLVANEQACCLPPPPPCAEGECLALTNICSDIVDNVGGNIAAPPAPVGYENPGVVSIYGDRPYGGFVDIFGTAECMAAVDYYEFEWATAASGPWNTMPPAAAGDIWHPYIQFSPLSFASATFSPAVPIGGQHVYETLQHYEATHDPAEWISLNRLWLGPTKDWLTRWRTEGTFADGTYYLRLKGWDLVAPDTLDNPRILKICDSEDDNYVVVRIDNRVVGSGPTDPRGHPCGTGTVHTCTDEPEAAILAVTIVHADATETPVAACGNVPVTESDWLQIDFVAHDPDGHLGRYTLQATYDVNLANNLLGLGGTLTPSPIPPPWASAAAQVGPTYTQARSANPPPYGGAAAPTWHGGAMRLKVKATGPGGAFPYTCCYQLELRSHKRTIVDCNYSDWSHTNYTEYSFNITV
jgi:hypothetical protein